ncbi:unnamed protein product [Phytophthora fragariaefolia]|uniref:Unnamed protein product n=1 Tax=Phytophthora fragariaefolia TaxID=1490495 RepID=A0A9W7CP62_9STRA|nr:unnamed protein product [Phytophthora fragariaefolia]
MDHLESMSDGQSSNKQPGQDNTCDEAPAEALFAASVGLETAQYNVNERILDTLMAYLLRHYPCVKKLNPDGLAIQRLEACAVEKGFTVNTLLSWSSHLACDPNTSSAPKPGESQNPATDITQTPLFHHQAALIEQLIEVNQKLDDRMSIMEDAFYNRQKRKRKQNDNYESIASKPLTKRKRKTSVPTSLKDLWFAWYDQEPRMWSSTESATKHSRSTTKLVVALLKLFLPEDFQLEEGSARYRDDVHETGMNAEREMLSFLQQHDDIARGSQNVLKSLRMLQKSGLLNNHIQRYQQLQAAGRIQDPAPSHTNNIIRLETHLLTMNATIASTDHLPEALEVTFASLADRCNRQIELKDIREWISAPGPSTEADDEAEWSTENDLSEQPLHAVRTVLAHKRLNRKTYYLVDWEPTWEPREHVAQTLIAGFEREWCALVRKTYIENEAVEDNTLNRTEG